MENDVVVFILSLLSLEDIVLDENSQNPASAVEGTAGRQHKKISNIIMMITATTTAGSSVWVKHGGEAATGTV